MGLDMYLTKRTYVKQWNHQDASEKFSVVVKKGGKVYKPIKSERVSYVIEQIAYWRKSNQIHNWFVKRVQEGKDECQESYVSIEKLKELRDTCKTVLNAIELKDGVVTNGYSVKKDKTTGEIVREPNLQQGKMIVGGEDVCKALLPASSGFFFGSTDYDQWYYEDVKNTYEMLEEILAEPDANYGDYYYQASW